MISGFQKVICLIALLLPFCAVAQNTDIKASVAIGIEPTDDIWSGQQVTINLDLKTTGFSFSDTHFNLPEVSGAFLLQTDTTTVKLTENIEGQSWQIIRYPLALYPQKAGRLEIPAIEVRFSTSAGFGSVKQAFEFQTRPLQLTVQSPPGVKTGELVVTTTSFELDHNWQGETETVYAGDAVTLTVRRRVSDISAMLLPPLPVFLTTGLAAYPQAPEVSDKSNRGSLTGERTDSIIWVLEAPGSYRIPDIRLQWWDPDRGELKQQIISGLKLHVLPSPADQVSTSTRVQHAPFVSNFLWWVLSLFAGVAAGFLWLFVGPRLSNPCADSEKTTFSLLQKACRSNQPLQVHAAIHSWLGWISPVLSPNVRLLTLSEFAQACDDVELQAELTRLQEALVFPDKHWRGGALLTLLQRNRRKVRLQKTVQSKFQLLPLNP